MKKTVALSVLFLLCLGAFAQGVIGPADFQFADEQVGKRIIVENAWLGSEVIRIDYSLGSNASQLDVSDGRLRDLYLMNVYDMKQRQVCQPYGIMSGPIPAAVASRAIARQWGKVCDSSRSMTKRTQLGGTFLEVSLYGAKALLFVIDSIEVADSDGKTVILK